MTVTVRPDESQPAYGASLGDAVYWGPYVREVLARQSFVCDESEIEIESGFVGSFPTFLCGDVVVKLFASAFDGHQCFAVELACRDAPRSPAVLASGTLYDDDSWPYIVFERVRGVAWRDAGVTSDVVVEVASALRELHALPVPAFRTGLLASLRAGAASRGRLPAHLCAQVDAYLSDALPPTTFVHGDVTEDHVFVAVPGDGRLQAIIDWGDALPADPFYELVPLFSGCFAGDVSLLRVFLDAYGWPVGPDFGRRMLQAMLSFQFDAFHGLSLPDVSTLDELAEALFGTL